MELIIAILMYMGALTGADSYTADVYDANADEVNYYMDQGAYLDGTELIIDNDLQIN